MIYLLSSMTLTQLIIPFCSETRYHKVQLKTGMTDTALILQIIP